MKHVTFARDELPIRRGERRLLPDEMAARLAAAGAIEPDPPSWPPRFLRDPAPSPAPDRATTKRPRILTKERHNG
jgi:hypothetical protein